MTDEPTPGEPVIDEPIPNGMANAAKKELLHTAEQAARLQIALVALAGLAVVLSSFSAVAVSLGNRRAADRARDCTDPQGTCYQQTRRATAEAIQVILDNQSNLMRPHRLRNEAENLCTVVALVEVTLAVQGHLPVDINGTLDHYRGCVTEQSGGTEPPPLPQNPLNTTTTTR
ncbi:MAG: hypothetical protein LC792_04005 [Actinobacteria bacterium]|nr:hypothetical protein [Actinomycetota bacterium]